MNKKFIEAFWSGTSQIVASKLLDLWQVNYNKSIANIQDYRQARWQQYKTDLILLDTKIILTDDQAGIGNSIVTGLFIQPEYTDQFNPGTNLKTFNGIPQINKILTTTRGYTVTRSTDAKVFLDDQLLAGKTNIAWRYSSTIIAPFNLEEEGVSSNDVLVIRIHSSTRYYDINCRVVGVKGNKAGFVWNLDTLTPGTPAAGISVADQIAGAKALNIPLELDIQGNPVYKELSLKINNELTSLAWKRLNYEKELNTVIVQGEEIYLEPIKIVRCTKIAIDPTIKAIPVLQEYIQAPDVYELNSTWYRTDNNKEISYPLILNENKDYSIISSDGINVRVNTNVLSDIVSVPFGSLDTFRIEPGDWIRFTQGLNTGNYEITQIIDPNTLKISKILNFAEVGANCIITKRVSKSWLTFSNTKRYPNFWAETTFIDNYKVIEDNFGSLVGLSYSDFKKQGIPVSYKTTIAGIVYAVTRGSQIDTIRLGATILLGLPFTTNAGTITFIEKEYKLDPVTGAPTFGQIIITRNSGVEDIYYFPRGRQIKLNGVWVDEDPILSGIAINPATKVEYQVGDEIPVYTALTKGVIVSDYLSNDSWTKLYTNTDIARYHTFYVRANPSLYGVANLSFVADYIKKIKATYLYIRTVGSIATKDIVKITDKLKLKMSVQQFDGIGQGLPPQILSSKRDILYKTDLAGNFYYRLIRGTASTQVLNDTVTTGAGLIAEQGTTKHDSPFVRPGDFVEFYNSPNSDLYTVLSVPSDTSLRLTTNSLAAKESAFSVYRQLKNPILTGTNLAVTFNSFSLQLPAGSISAGVCPGDYISLYTNIGQGIP
jgi:hypothetical protein